MLQTGHLPSFMYGRSPSLSKILVPSMLIQLCYAKRFETQTPDMKTVEVRGR